MLSCISQLISPGVAFWSIGGTGTGRLCRIRALAGLGLGATGSGVTHTGLGWSRGLLLRMLLAFSVAAEDRETSGAAGIPSGELLNAF